MSTQVEGLRRFAARRNAERWQWTGDPTIVVAGARTGSGTSTFAAMLALACAADGRQTLLVDANDAAGAQHRLLGAATDRSIVELQQPSLDAQELLTPVADNCMLLPCAPFASPHERPFGTAERRSVHRRLAQLYPEFDVVIIDAGSKLDGVIAAAGRGAWRFIAVGASDPLALASSYALVKTVDMRWLGVPVDFLVNRDTEPQGRAGFEQVRAGAKHFLNRDVGFAGTIPADGAVAGSAQSGHPLQSLIDHSVAGRGAKQIAVRLLAELDQSINRLID